MWHLLKHRMLDISVDTGSYDGLYEFVGDRYEGFIERGA